MDPPADLNVSTLPVPIQLCFKISGTPSRPGIMVSYKAILKTVVPFVWPIDHHGD
ncbi:hypothetical protein K443DRAFT_4273 [Laccaria amethystina LaAM-08-1]|uniref:Uncharacterized protein n=1 Tax=Laccaria amethystina LaAM-08-1 TaxID=1095629 RepID=A0A0C9Y499_9AGAR|nr:hypothetical protein K443DRAFT_4273 [Laccaria amethystina LaAM-08-1]